MDFKTGNSTFNKQTIKYINELNINYFEGLLLNAKEEYFSLYTLVLKNNILLLNSSVANNSTSDINLIINSFSELIPNQFQMVVEREIINQLKMPEGPRELLNGSAEFAENF
ncbi:hypothetical protein E2R55_27185 [Vibrio vulnificus]|nr:hypothetical protein E2R55_27185 [Vibrio vulnificus]